jgi:DNA-binding NtrC family response regulator
VERTDGRKKKSASSGTETIVLLDDDQAIRTAAVRALTRQGYTVIEASSGPEAVRLAAAHNGPIDLLVTDVVMPGASGPQVAAEFARLWPNAKVIYMSGYTANVVAQQTFENSVTFLEKPFAPTTFLAKVRAVLDA